MAITQSVSNTEIGITQALEPSTEVFDMLFCNLNLFPYKPICYMQDNFNNFNFNWLLRK